MKWAYNKPVSFPPNAPEGWGWEKWPCCAWGRNAAARPSGSAGKSGREAERGSVLRAQEWLHPSCATLQSPSQEAYTFPWCHLPHWNLFLRTVTTVHFHTIKEDFIQQKKSNICSCAHSPLPPSDNWTKHLVVGQREWKCSTWKNLEPAPSTYFRCDRIKNNFSFNTISIWLTCQILCSL